ncbi:MAG: UDP-N-acetylmuramate dehydrogenase [Oscillospiraceae bacterium]|nr:UDP-N-acetylmuramate dehydrogenase [Oscillospiraceae bacterium]
MKELLEKLVGAANVLIDEPMKNHTSFKIGGPADFIVVPQTKKSLCDTVKTLREQGIPITIIGNGSNLLVSDKGIRGVVVKIAGGLNGVEVERNTITAQSGVLLSRLASVACSSGLTGLEFAAGIPGTVGGAIVMNAGAYDHEMKEVVTETTYIDENGNLGVLKGVREHKFGYRASIFQSENWIILESVFRLKPGNIDEIRAEMDSIARKRKRKQPLEFPSAGSAFKRPLGGFAAKLIDDAGLKGAKIGGAMVSDKHSGFIINVGNATANDVCELLKKVQTEVSAQFGITLEPEVKMIGEF